jgi:hypothetical protein
MTRIIREFFETTEQLDQFILELPSDSLIKIIKDKLCVFTGVKMAVYNNRLIQLDAGKLAKVIQMKVTEPSEPLPLGKKKKHRH